MCTTALSLSLSLFLSLSFSLSLSLSHTLNLSLSLSLSLALSLSFALTQLFLTSYFVSFNVFPSVFILCFLFATLPLSLSLRLPCLLFCRSPLFLPLCLLLSLSTTHTVFPFCYPGYLLYFLSLFVSPPPILPLSLSLSFPNVASLYVFSCLVSSSLCVFPSMYSSPPPASSPLRLSYSLFPLSFFPSGDMVSLAPPSPISTVCGVHCPKNLADFRK
jgi:hypothetical protein